MARVLIVDDDPEFVESTKAVLETKGHKVTSAPNGQAGYEKAGKDKPDIMILDVMMATDSEGFEIARKISHSPDIKDIPVIMLTGIRKAKNLPFKFDPDEDWLPVKAVLEKPVAPEVLLKEVEKALGKK